MAVRWSIWGSAARAACAHRKRRAGASRTVWLFYHTRAASGEYCLAGACGVESLFVLRDSGEHLGHEARVQSVPGAMRGDLTDHGAPDESEVAVEIEDLVPYDLVAEPQRPVHDAALIQDDAVLHRAAASEARRAELLHVTHESECASRGDLAREVVVLRVEME